MKIKTITTHDVYNYGASLQAYALMTYLKSLGYDVEIIDYKPDYLTRKYDYKWVNPESMMSKYMITRVAYRVMKFLQRQTTMGRKCAFDSFTNTFLHLTSAEYHSNYEMKHAVIDADVFIVGSDQVWNTFYESGRDAAFYLDFTPKGKKRISYAASFSISKLEDNVKGFVREYLQAFDNISVRERQGLNILSELGIDGTWVLDPVFLLPRIEWEKMLVPIKNIEPYILIYDFERNESMKRFTIDYARIHNLKIYSINDTYPLMYADRNFNSAGPLEFLSLIHHCNCFVSNSFHGSAFSIIFGKEFYVFARMRHKVNSRMESLLSMFGLNDRYVKNIADVDMEKAIDYDKIEKLRKKHLKRSVDYLDNALK